MLHLQSGWGLGEQTHGRGGRWEISPMMFPSLTRWWFQIFFYFTPKIGEDFQLDDHIFQMG